MKYSKTYVLVPEIHRSGGIANYYKVIKEHLSDNFEYIYRGKKTDSESGLVLPFRLIFDYIYFCYKVWFKPNSIIVNTSLGNFTAVRDGIYMLISPFSSKKIVFFRGWDPKFEAHADQNRTIRFWLRHTFLKADKILVLSSEFKEKLIEWGYNGTIKVDTTVADETLLNGTSWQTLHNRRIDTGGQHLLFLGSIIKDKGVWEITKAMRLLKDQNRLNDINLTIAGKGNELEDISEFSTKNNLPVSFPGYVNGKQKANNLMEATLFLFASYHEGMPNAVLEAMAFGLPILTTPVGGLPEFFEEGKMGLYLESRDPEYIADRIKYLISSPELMKSMSEYNYAYAEKHFYSDKVAERLQNLVD